MRHGQGRAEQGLPGADPAALVVEGAAVQVETNSEPRMDRVIDTPLALQRGLQVQAQTRRPADDLQEAVGTPGTPAWAELNRITRAEVSQATGMLIAQLEITPTEALVRLRAHAYATNRSATDVARDILDRRLRLDPH